MLELSILFPSVLNGLTTGAVYALIALGLTLIYGVLHIINFAHGAALMIALYGVYFLHRQLGIDPYLALPIMVPAMFAARLRPAALRHRRGEPRQGREHPARDARPRDRAREPGALLVQVRHAHDRHAVHALDGEHPRRADLHTEGGRVRRRARRPPRCCSSIVGRTDLGRAIRAIAKERQGARLVGIDVDHVFAMSFGIGLACLGAAACFLLPAYYVNPRSGTASC